MLWRSPWTTEDLAVWAPGAGSRSLRKVRRRSSSMSRALTGLPAAVFMALMRVTFSANRSSMARLVSPAVPVVVVETTGVGLGESNRADG